MNQLNHSEITNSQHDKEIVIIGDQIEDKKNIGMMFRLADAFGALAILSNKNFQVKTDGKINRISRSTSSKTCSLQIMPRALHLLVMVV